MDDDNLGRAITPEEAKQHRDNRGEDLLCYCCEEPIERGEWVEMRPNSAYPWCDKCLRGD